MILIMRIDDDIDDGDVVVAGDDGDVPLHLRQGEPGRAAPALVPAPVLDLLDHRHRQQGGRLVHHLGPAHRAARVDPLEAGLADAMSAWASEDRTRTRHLEADRALHPVLQLLGEGVQLVLGGGALPPQLHHHPAALPQLLLQVGNLVCF